MKLAALLVTGAAIGWLMGLSVSPVVGIVLTSMLGASVTVIGVMAALPGDTALPGTRMRTTLGAVSPYPLLAIMVGIAAGSPLGSVARTGGWFGDVARSGDPGAATPGLRMPCIPPP